LPPSRGAAAARTRTLAALLAVVLAASGCSPGRGGRPGGATPTTVPQRRGGTLQIALVQPRSLDPARAERQGERILADSLFDGLTALGPDGAAVPAVAASWSADPSQRRFEFRLRPGLTFADGSPVQADRFVAAWERVARSPQPALRALLRRVVGAQEFADGRRPRLDGLQAPGPDRFVVELVEPFADLPSLAADPALAPVPAQARTDPARFAAAPAGNGPFVLADRASLTPAGTGSRIELARNPAFRGRPAWVDAVHVLAVPDGQTAWLAFQEGKVRFAPVPVDQLAAARALLGVTPDERSRAGLVAGPTAAVDLIGLDTRVAPFDDRDYRLGFALAIDRQRLQRALAGARAPADALVPDGLPRGGPPPRCEPCAHDLARARALLARGRATPVTLAIPGDDRSGQVASLIARDLAAAGVRLEIVKAPAAGAVRPRPGVVLRTLGDASTIGLLAASLTVAGSAAPTAPGGTEPDPRLTQAASAADPATRLRLAAQVEQEALDDVDVIPLMEHRQTAALAPGTQGFDLTPQGTVDLSAASLIG